MAAHTTTSTSPAARTAAGGPGTDPTRHRAHGLTVLPWLLRQQRRALIGWTIAAAVVCAIYVSFYPAMGDTGELEALIAGMPEGVVAALGYDAIGSAAGYLESTVFALLGPILLLVFALATAARVIAGEEEAGSLELELAAPVSRRSVLLQRYAALVVGVAWLSVVVAAVTVGLVAALDIDVAAGRIVETTLGLFLLVLAVGSVGFAAGVVTGRRVVALSVGAGLAVLSYMANALAPLLDDGAWLEAISPFAWYLASEPLVEGLSLLGALGLLLLAVVPVVAAVVRFERRDLGV